MAYALLGLWLFTIVYMRILYQTIGSKVNFENVVITEDYQNIAGLLMAALFIWILSHIFITGLKLNEEQEITI